MATYVPGQKYLRNKVTGAVFQYREAIAGFSALELHEADEAGVLQKVVNRVPPSDKLSPTKTPEKAGDTGKPTPKPAATAKTATTAKPTMIPVSKT